VSSTDIIPVDELYSKLDEAYSSLNELLQQCTTSQVITKFITDKIKSTFYANLILNFFANLNQKVIEEKNLPRGRIKDIKRKYNLLNVEARKATTEILRHKNIDEISYSRFKASLRRYFPEFGCIIYEIENAVDIPRAKKYFQKKEEEMKKIGKPKEDFDATLMTSLLETCIKKNNTIPTAKETLIKLTRRYVNRS
jgi:hypothetical protein